MTESQILNLIREYLQVLILKAIYGSTHGKGLSFMGGTSLRICYDLKRYSEDLDFTLDRKYPGYSFEELNQTIQSFLKNTDFDVDLNISSDKTVQKSYIKVNKVLHLFGVSPIKTQKLHIKLEVDTKPPKAGKKDLESFFVTKFDEIFPIIKHKLPTLFVGKIAALLNRNYAKGRDYYDLIWYLKQGTEINFRYLNACVRQDGDKRKFKDAKSVISALKKRIHQVDTKEILSDIDRFLESAEEKLWIKDYEKVFSQLSQGYLE